MACDVLGAVELGGTKIKLATGTRDGRIVSEKTFATAGPDAAFETILQYFTANPVAAIGVGAFGPITVARQSPRYGQIGRTPKPGWSGFNILAALAPLAVPVAIDTDVNASLLGEALWGAAAGHRVAVYLTVGTGIGGGLLIDGNPVHGLLHPEMGHVQIVRASGDNFRSLCRFHPHCAEGLACGSAIMARFGKPLSNLPTEHSGHDLIANYLGQLCTTIFLMTSTETIIVGGGVAKTPNIHRSIARHMLGFLNGYIAESEEMLCTIVPPALGDSAGLLGGLALSRNFITP
ncbi:MAG: ROK family protein [Sandarakinorhabdus sp.]|nr:ROK family protein [Sandarakinorhabdus sp.]